MGRRPVENKRSPAEYPQFAFRLSREDKKRLSGAIEDIQQVLNKRRDNGEPFINKNDVIIKALDLGLKALRK